MASGIGGGRFQDNQLRLRLACNSLQAFASSDVRPRDACDEAAALAGFLETDLPVILGEQERTVRAALRKRVPDAQARSVSSGLIREDLERLLALSGMAADALRQFGKRRGRPDRQSLRDCVSRYLAAQRHFMAWSDRLVHEQREAQ